MFTWLIQALRSDSAADGQALGETRKQLKEETLLRLVSFRLLTMFTQTYTVQLQLNLYVKELQS